MDVGVWLLAFVALCAVCVAVVLLIRRPVQRRLFAGTGLEQWRTTAPTLPWRDRWSLWLATGWGRATEPRLAPLAVQRATMVIAITERSGTNPFLRRGGLVIGCFGVLDLVLQAAGLVLDHDASTHWWDLISPVILILIGFGGAAIRGFTTRRAERAIELNAPQQAVNG